MRSLKITDVQAEVLTDFIEEAFLKYASDHPRYHQFSYIAEMTELHKKLQAGTKKAAAGGKKKEEGDLHEQTLEETKEAEIEWIR